MNTTMPQVSDVPEKPAKRKVRAAWIAFAGRIVAQILGAVVTIGLGLLFLQKYQSDNSVAHSAPLAPQTVGTTMPRPALRNAIGVLPLADFSPDPKEPHFADAMTDALIAELSQIEGHRVISRTSAMRYKAEVKSLTQIGQELGVDLIVEGSIVKANDRVRVIVQLIDATTDEHIWARRYDRTIGDVLALQGEMATAIARDLQTALASHTHDRTDSSVVVLQPR